MLTQLRERVTSVLAHIELTVDPQSEEELLPRRRGQIIESREDPAFSGMAGQDPANPSQGGQTLQPMRTAVVDPKDPSSWGGSSRNAPCPCGSGKKYKYCHGSVR
ncbi:MAG TPA: hypothetical protein HPP80_09140 [Rhodospirillaceae bacterium]|nr:hypothetical protein [Rhodospirillaceae bacterium]